MSQADQAKKVFIVESDETLWLLACAELRKRGFRIVARAASFDEAENCIRSLKARGMAPDIAVIATRLTVDGEDGTTVAWTFQMEDLHRVRKVMWANTPTDEVDGSTLVVHKCATHSESVAALVAALICDQKSAQEWRSPKAPPLQKRGRRFAIDEYCA